MEEQPSHDKSIVEWTRQLPLEITPPTRRCMTSTSGTPMKTASKDDIYFPITSTRIPMILPARPHTSSCRPLDRQSFDIHVATSIGTLDRTPSIAPSLSERFPSMKSPILPHTKLLGTSRSRSNVLPLWKKQATVVGTDQIRFVWTLTQVGKVALLTTVLHVQSLSLKAEFRLRPASFTLVRGSVQCHEVYRVPIQIRNCGLSSDRSRLTKVQVMSGQTPAHVRTPDLQQRTQDLAPGLCLTIDIELVFVLPGPIEGVIEIQTRIGFHTIPISGHVY